MKQLEPRILLTGGNGFLGRIIKSTMESQGHTLSTLGLSNRNEIQCDLGANVPSLSGTFQWVVHNAGKAHIVPKNIAQAEDFFTVNVSGTEHLLQALNNLSDPPAGIVYISSVSVYGCDSGENISETQPLNARDSYGMSKIEAEDRILSWGKQHRVPAAIFRLPLIAGPNPPGNLGAMINAIRKGFYFRLGEGKVRKSMVMAEDVGKIIGVAAQRGGIFNLTDGYHPSFAELEEIIRQQLKAKAPIKIPYGVARVMGIGGDMIDFFLPGKSPVTSKKIEKMLSTLTFADQNAREALNWNPTRVIDAFTI